MPLRDHDVRGIGGRAGERHALGDLSTQFLVTRRQQTFASVSRMVAQHFANQIVEPLIRIQRRRGERAVELQDVRSGQRFTTSVECFRGDGRRSARTTDLRSWRRHSRAHRRPDIEPRLRPRFDQPDVFQVQVRLHHCRDADFRRAAHGAHRRNALIAAQGAARDLRFDQARDAFVEQRFLGRHSQPPQLYWSWVSLPESVLLASTGDEVPNRAKGSCSMSLPASPTRLSAGMLAAFAAIYFFWGTTYLAIAVAIREIPPFISGSMRFMLAGLAMYAWLRWRDAKPLANVDLKMAALTGVLLTGVGNGFVVWAQQGIPSGIAGR